MPAVNSCRYGLPTFLMMESARKSRGTLQLLAATLMRPRISPAMAGACDILLSSAIIVRVLITCLAGNAPRLSTSPAYARRRAIASCRMADKLFSQRALIPCLPR